jgi:hypothetical protein
MTLEQIRLHLIAEFPKADIDDIDTYVFGPDNPEAYFATFEPIASMFEIECDFREFYEERQ